MDEYGSIGELAEEGREELRFWRQRLEEHASQHSVGIMEDCLRVFKSIAALVEVYMDWKLEIAWLVGFMQEE